MQILQTLFHSLKVKIKNIHPFSPDYPGSDDWAPHNSLHKYWHTQKTTRAVGLTKSQDYHTMKDTQRFGGRGKNWDAAVRFLSLDSWKPKPFYMTGSYRGTNQQQTLFMPNPRIQPVGRWRKGWYSKLLTGTSLQELRWCHWESRSLWPSWTPPTQFFASGAMARPLTQSGSCSNPPMWRQLLRVHVPNLPPRSMRNCFRGGS